MRGCQAFPEALLKELRQLIPCECVSYGDFAGRAVRRKQIRTASGRVTPEDIRRTIDRLRDRHPLLAGPIAVGLPLRQSDVMTRREIRSNPVCQLGRLVGIQYAMDLWIADHGRIVGGFGFDATNRDFSERDKLVLEVLAPHLVQLHRRASARRSAAKDEKLDA